MPSTIGTPLLWTGFLVLVFVMLALDLIYPLIDPRIKYRQG